MRRFVVILAGYLGFVPAAQLRRAEDALAVATDTIEKARALAGHEVLRRRDAEDRFDRYREAVLSGAFGVPARVDGLYVQLELPEPAFAL
ncbi:hypothetical protein DMC25_06490 [Caulobacter sp. D4A]|uniref:hypothetical protein n=1 Tax=unclassified Caulobacter TaxID=2648921 RepID=UPI000D725A16|nr:MULTISPECIES: hypothetical protein [unclassified Caulobacter]PXA91197.1 hypothetical protein DMC25_06490 [Caulobacter sp. D4A]PXA96782.1 hypothetical protein DMC18_00530 [Caulobacter sp. D5]